MVHSNPKQNILFRRSPALYNHISSFRPKFINRISNVSQFDKTVMFRSEIIPDKEKGTLTTSLLYSQGSDIYEVDCALPLGSFYKGSKKGEKIENKKIPDSENGDAFQDVEEKKLSAKWVYSGETISKMAYLDDSEDSTIIAMSKNGSLAWFRDGVKVPVHIVQEMMGPSTRFSAIHSHKRPNNLAVSDFGLSENTETLVKSQASGSEDNSILKIVDNSCKPGEILRTIKVPGTTVTHSVRFFDNYLFGSCSDDNVVRFWDTRTAEKPMFQLSEPQNGRITAFDASQITNELFVTGSSTGVIKLWDLRAVEFATTDFTNRQNGEEPIQNELVSLYHTGADSVIDIQFSQTSSSEFFTVGNTGNVYHWDMEYYFSKNDDDNEQSQNTTGQEELQGQCLKFFHTGNNRPHLEIDYAKKNTVAWHPIIDDFVCTVDDSSILSVYKPFTVRDLESFED